MENISENCIDILNRDSIVNRIYSIIKKNAEDKKFMSFAINGEQGVGKTYIVNKIIEKLKNDNDFIVIKYDCWKNDYYSEPLKAILLNIIDEISDNIENIKDKAKEAINIVISDLKKVVDEYLTDRSVVYKAFRYFYMLGKKVEEKSLEHESHDVLDENNSLNIILEKTRDGIIKLSKEKTIVIFVDELDRCVPDYVIKVLERTHHIYYGIDNLIIIYVYDESLLIGSIKQMFGDKISIDKYLTKFINYNLTIGQGECGIKLFEKYEAFFSTERITTNDKSFISTFIKNSKVNVRNVDKMFDNLTLINNVININTTHKNYVSIIEFEIIVYIVKIIFREYFKVNLNPSYAYQTKNFINDIVTFKDTDFDKRFPTELIKVTINYFSRINASYSGGEILHIMHEPINKNLLDCMFILDQLYGCGKYKKVDNVDEVTIGVCAEIKSYIEMFTISN